VNDPADSAGEARPTRTIVSDVEGTITTGEGWRVLTG
jgi:hypothetical protein